MLLKAATLLLRRHRSTRSNVIVAETDPAVLPGPGWNRWRQQQQTATTLCGGAHGSGGFVDFYGLAGLTRQWRRKHERHRKVFPEEGVHVSAVVVTVRRGGAAAAFVAVRVRRRGGCGTVNKL